jgi:hypothetical protein
VLWSRRRDLRERISTFLNESHGRDDEPADGND